MNENEEVLIKLAEMDGDKLIGYILENKADFPNLMLTKAKKNAKKDKMESGLTEYIQNIEKTLEKYFVNE